MEITFFGTSSGTPTRQRNVSGIAISQRDSKSWCLVDCGEGTQHQVLKSRYALNQLEAIFISHVHGDHCYGLPGLLASAAMSGKTSPIKLICPTGVQAFLELIIQTTELRLSYEIEYIDVASLSKTIQLKEFDVDIIALSHRVPSHGFSFLEKPASAKLNKEKLMQDGIPQGKLWGTLHKGIDVKLENGSKIIAAQYLLPPEKPRKIIICGDNDTPSLLSEYAENASLLVHEATYTKEIAEKVGPGPQHSYAELVAKFAEERRLPNLILTHFSARYSEDNDSTSSISQIKTEAESVYSGNLFLANDLDVFYLDKKINVVLAAQARKI